MLAEECHTLIYQLLVKVIFKYTHVTLIMI